MGIQMERHTLPDGSEPQVSHCTIDFTPAVSISLGDTIFTLTGFTIFLFLHQQKREKKTHHERYMRVSSYGK